MKLLAFALVVALAPAAAAGGYAHENAERAAHGWEHFVDGCEEAVEENAFLVGLGGVGAVALLVGFVRPAREGVARGLRALPLTVLPLFSRLPKDRLLDLDARRRLHAAAVAEPGVSLEAAAERAGVTRTTAAYHLRRLEKAGILTSRREGRTRRYAPVGAAIPPAPLGHPNGRALADLVRANPGVDQSTLAREAGLGPSLAHWHLARLEAAGVLRKERDGGRVRYWLA